MAGRYAARTTVPVEQTRIEIEQLLERYGAGAFGYARQGSQHGLMFEAHGRRVRFLLPLPDPSEREFTHTPTGIPRTRNEAAKAHEQAVRQRWRALLLVIKAKLEAIETGLVTFESEFLSQTLLPQGGSVGEWIEPQIERAYQTGEMPAMLPGLDRQTIPLPAGREA